MPRIETQTLAEHRDWRRNQLIEAAAASPLSLVVLQLPLPPLLNALGCHVHLSTSISEVALNLLLT
jgi:hypothetical protein